MCQECYDNPVIQKFFEKVYQDCRRLSTASEALASAVYQYIEEMNEKGEEFRSPLPSTRSLQEALAISRSASLFIICMVESDFNFKLATKRYRDRRGDILINAPPTPDELLRRLANIEVLDLGDLVGREAEIDLSNMIDFGSDEVH